MFRFSKTNQIHIFCLLLDNPTTQFYQVHLLKIEEKKIRKIIRWRTQRMLDTGKLMKKKQQLRKYIIDSNPIVNVFKHCKTLNLTISFLLFQKTIKTIFMLCFNVFLLPIFNWRLLRVLYIAIGFGVF